MNCQEWTNQISEAARSGKVLSPTLTSHLSACAACRDEWEAQLALSGELARLRGAFAGQRSAEFNRARLMNEYRVMYSRPARARRFDWMFVAAAAAVLLVAVVLSWRTQTPAPAQGSQTAVNWQEDSSSVFEDVSGEGGFIAVPYAAPLAKGEFVRIVRTELYAAALDRMGFSVPAANGEFPADVVVGEDGLPRAVRVLAQD